MAHFDLLPRGSELRNQLRAAGVPDELHDAALVVFGNAVGEYADYLLAEYERHGERGMKAAGDMLNDLAGQASE